MYDENKEKEKKQLSVFFCTEKVKFDRRLQKPIDTDQDETSSINASYNKGIHTVVITQLDNL